MIPDKNPELISLLSVLDNILLLLERQHRVLEAMQETCLKIEKTYKGDPRENKPSINPAF